jgi:ankyrin repeat protein
MSFTFVDGTSAENPAILNIPFFAEYFKLFDTMKIDEDRYKLAIQYYGKEISTIEICEILIEFLEHYDADVTQICAEYFKLSELHYLYGDIMPKYTNNKKFNQYLLEHYPIFDYYVKRLPLVLPDNCDIVTVGYYLYSGFKWSVNYCCTNNSLTILKYLVDNGARISSAKSIPMFLACKNGHFRIVKYLYKKNNAQYSFELCCASEKGYLKIVKYLHKKGSAIDIYNNKPILRAIKNKHLDVVKYLFEHSNKETLPYERLIWDTCEFGNLKILKYLHENGVDVVTQNNVSIVLASEVGNLEIVKYLHENGADITAQENKSLLFAAKNGHLDVVKYLVKNGADKTADDNLARYWANQNEHYDVVEFLLDF